MTSLAVGVAFGGTLGIGLWLLLLAMPRFRRRSLIDRLALELADVNAAAREHLAQTRTDILPVIGTVGVPLTAGVRRMAAAVGTPAEIERRLHLAGVRCSVIEYQVQRLLCGLLGAAVGVLVTVPGVSADRWLGPVAAAVVGFVAGVVLRDAELRQRGERRVRQISSELPSVLELLSLSVAAGESIPDAIRRVARVGRGLIAAELGVVSRHVATGVPLATALREMARRMGHPALERALDHFVAALDRGSPLAETLQAQATDQRVASRQALMEAAGHSEVAMLVPLVFLILPATVAIAVFPGLLVLQMGFG